MAWTINGTEIATPNSYKEDFDFLGEINVTLKGSRRRSVRGVKRNISVAWKQLSNTDYQTLRNAFLTQDPDSVLYTGDLPTLNVDDSELGISNMSVIMDMDSREVIAATDYLSQVEVVFYEV